jgi:hypothetical protein
MASWIHDAPALCVGLMLGCVSGAASGAASRSSDDVATLDGDGVAAKSIAATAPDNTRRREPAHARRLKRLVFVCRGVAPVIFSDRPCGQLFEEHLLEVSVPVAGRVASTAPAPAPAATRPRVQPTPSDEKVRANDDLCRRLREQREKIDQRMRTGYSAREAANLWSRWREIDAEIYAARC